MWKLTIEQRRKSEYSDSIFEEKVSFMGTLQGLTALVEMILVLSTDYETSYRIEKVGDK